MKHASLLLAASCLLSFVNAQWLEATIQLPGSSGPMALGWNPQNDKVYCADSGADNVTVLNGATNQVMATVQVGDGPHFFCYNPHDNKMYCSIYYGGNVVAIDGASNQVVATVPAGIAPAPCATTLKTTRSIVPTSSGAT